MKNNKSVDITNDKVNLLYKRTLANCDFYERADNKEALLNEIGVLRGIAYCMEVLELDFVSEKFLHFMEVQEQCVKRCG